MRKLGLFGVCNELGTAFCTRNCCPSWQGITETQVPLEEAKFGLSWYNIGFCVENPKLAVGIGRASCTACGCICHNANVKLICCGIINGSTEISTFCNKIFKAIIFTCEYNMNSAKFIQCFTVYSIYIQWCFLYINVEYILVN